MPKLTVIPDIHADLTRLDVCLEESRGAPLAFLGDFIDAGKATRVADDLAVLRRVRSLIEGGRAISVMGNHELNAILYHRQHRDGTPLRAHSPKNARQHASFLEQIGQETPEAIHWTEWFLTLPLWIDLGGLRLVHACWDQRSIDIVKERRPDGRLRTEDLAEIARNETEFARAVEAITSGPEVRLPSGYLFHDMKGEPRQHVRIAWWLSNGGTWRDVALSVPDPGELPDAPVEGAEGIPVYGVSQVPVLVGHYKMQGAPNIAVAQAACLDYPERYCVYHWDGESALNAAHLRSRAPDPAADGGWR